MAMVTPWFGLSIRLSIRSIVGILIADKSCPEWRSFNIDFTKDICNYHQSDDDYSEDSEDFWGESQSSAQGYTCGGPFRTRKKKILSLLAFGKSQMNRRCCFPKLDCLELLIQYTWVVSPLLQNKIEELVLRKWIGLFKSGQHNLDGAHPHTIQFSQFDSSSDVSWYSRNIAFVADGLLFHSSGVLFLADNPGASVRRLRSSDDWLTAELIEERSVSFDPPQVLTTITIDNDFRLNQTNCSLRVRLCNCSDVCIQLVLRLRNCLLASLDFSISAINGRETVIDGIRTNEKDGC